MMRIGIDATALPPQPVGAGNYIIHLVRALVALDSGDEFVIFAQQGGASLINIPDGNGVEWIILPDRNPGIRLIWEQISFPKLVQRSGVDLLHSLHYTRPVWLPCKSVVTYHDMTFFLYPHLHARSKRVFFPMAIRASARQADALIAVSESTRQDAIRILGIPPQKITTAQLGVDPSFTPISDIEQKRRIAEKYHLPKKFILYVGLVEPRKNLPKLISAYKKSVDNGIEHKLVVVGRYGWMYEEVFRQIEALNLKDNVFLAGYISQEDLPMVYNLASLFVYPTLYEGFGLPSLEAMACGLPVISTNVSSLPEIIGDAGVLVPPDDVDSLYQAIQKVLKDEKLSEDLIQKGLEQAAKFTWERTARSTLQVYRQVKETG
jgi:glycosyltransferase involved in cell wall biosynthesis